MNKYLKALTAAVVAALVSLKAAVDGGISPAEGFEAAIVFFTALAAVWAVPNAGK